MFEKHHKKDFILGAMIGSTLGAFSAIISNPQKRNKIKKELLNKYHEFQSAVKKFMNQSNKSKIKKVKKTINAYRSRKKRRKAA